MRRFPLLLIPLLVFTPVQGSMPSIPEEGPIILVYSGSMREWASSLCGLMDADPRIPGEYVVVEDRDLFSLLLFLPRTQAIVLAPMAATDVKGLGPMILDFFEQGGAVLGFSPCTDVRGEPVLGSLVFPFFCNKSIGSERVGTTPVNTYVVRQEDTVISEGLPGTFKLVSSGFLFTASPSGEKVELLPDEGIRRVFYEEGLTRAPLVMGYQREGSGRSLGFSACRVNEVQRSTSYFGRLIEQDDYVQLFRNSMVWTLEGSTRYEDLDRSWQGILDEEAGRREEAKARGRDMRKRETQTRNLLLIGIWAGAALLSVVSVRLLILGK